VNGDAPRLRILRYRIEPGDGGVEVHLEGQLNFAANDCFQALLAELETLRAPKVAFEMSALSHIDSVGLGLLYVAREDIVDLGGTVILARPRDNVRRMLELTEADKTFTITR